jgi:hypothetical protein
MTAHELAAELLAGPDIEVAFAYNYGDYWRTTVAKVVSSVDTGKTKYSDYHSMDTVVDDDADTEDGEGADDATINTVIILG